MFNPANIGATELIIILIIAMLIFGPTMLPKLGRRMGEGLRAMKGIKKEIQEGLDGVDQEVRAATNDVRGVQQTVKRELHDVAKLDDRERRRG